MAARAARMVETARRFEREIDRLRLHDPLGAEPGHRQLYFLRAPSGPPAGHGLPAVHRQALSALPSPCTCGLIQGCVLVSLIKTGSQLVRGRLPD